MTLGKFEFSLALIKETCSQRCLSTRHQWCITSKECSSRSSNRGNIAPTTNSITLYGDTAFKLADAMANNATVQTTLNFQEGTLKAYNSNAKTDTSKDTYSLCLWEKDFFKSNFHNHGDSSLVLSLNLCKLMVEILVS